jgi:hypothetical protein
MSDPRSARIAELRAETAREKATEQRAVSEGRMKQQLAHGVLRAVEQVEEALEAKIKALDEVENMGDEELEAIRERRFRQAKDSALKAEQLKLQGHGEYRTVVDEKDFFAQVKGSERVVAHFGRSTTARCEIVDGHLTKLARRHLETKFIRVEAERTPYLADKLKVHVLPSIVLIKNNKTEHTLVGFEELGGDDDFATGMLEKVLHQYGVVNSVSEGADTTRFGKTSTRPVRRGKVNMDDWED